MTKTNIPNPVATQNDRFRTEGPSPALKGLLVITAGIAALPSLVQAEIVASMQRFCGFDGDNDPYGEHDFGAVDVAGAGKVFWKIDYYADADMEFGSEVPADPAQTFRVLTIMLAGEY